MELKNVEIIKIGELQTFPSGYTKVDFVVRDDSSQYPQEIQFSINKDKAEKFIEYNKVGQRVDVSFNLNGRSWLKEGSPETDRKWFNDLNAWKIFKSDSKQPETTSFEPATNLNAEDHEDLPF